MTLAVSGTRLTGVYFRLLAAGGAGGTGEVEDWLVMLSAELDDAEAAADAVERFRRIVGRGAAGFSLIPGFEVDGMYGCVSLC